MSPILVRPVREQLEHDRVIRLLQAKYKRKFEVATNIGNEQSVAVPVGQSTWYPDLVLQSQRGRKILGVVEVETSESVNKVEAMSQWAAFSRSRAAFHLYVPSSMIDVARQLCGDLNIPVGEFWAYSALGDQLRFTLVQRSSRAEEKTRAAAPARSAATARRPAGTARRRAAKTAKPAAARGAAARKKTARGSRAQKRR